MTAYQQPPPLEADDLVEKIKSKMVCDMTIPEGDSRVDRMVAAASRYAEEIGQSWIFDVEPKLFAEAIISQLQPPGLKAQEYHDEARELRKLKATKAAAVTPQMTKSESQRIGAAAAKSTEKEQGTSRSNQDVKCLKCGSSEHKVREHTGITEEAKKLISDLYGKNHQKRVKTLLSEDPSTPLHIAQC
ncbi:hypothetical protein DYB32_008586 [Aphanomyces invadans]|uniref:Uncharacterized protein n=1 Tax=Aphanomyces invadans TaxID=157072 RepID=A0A3R7A446_9STRA|nr:hypothetical protein DYB32_008586 [Aphanomyces invadans]